MRHFVSSLWHGARWLRRPFAYFHQEARRRGLTWQAPLPGLGLVLVSGDPALLAEIIDHPDLVGGVAHKALRATLGEHHLIVSHGAAHRERRNIVLRALRAFPKDELVAELTRQEVLSHPVGQRFCLWQAGHRASLRIMLHALLGPLSEQDEAPLLLAAQRFQHSFRSPLLLFLPFLRRDWGPYSPWGRLLRRRAELVALLLRQQPAGDCIAARLRPHLDRAGYTNELLALLMFGHETTAASLAWCLAHAFARPDHWQRLREGEEPLPFVQECLRVSPPVAQLTRVATAPTNVGPWRLEEGSVVMPAIPLAHSSLAAPEEFRPERFATQPPPTAYCPFGFGNRLCPGRAIALRQLTVMLSTLLGQFDWEPVRISVKPRRHLFLVLPRGGVEVRRQA